MIVKFHREGKKPILSSLILLLFINLLLLVIYHFDIPSWIPVTSVVIEVFIIQFFYNPERSIKEYHPDYVYSPADGTIVNITRVFESEIVKREMVRISIFMNIFNVHLNRVPISGEIIYQKYHPGRYLVAFLKKSSLLNENNCFAIRDSKNRIVFMKQIAGFIARRIVWYVNQGDRVNAGDELGFIKFGSRVDIFLPPESDIYATLNQSVKATKTILAKLPS